MVIGAWGRIIKEAAKWRSLYTVQGWSYHTLSHKTRVYLKGMQCSKFFMPNWSLISLPFLSNMECPRLLWGRLSLGVIANKLPSSCNSSPNIEKIILK